MNRSSRGFSPDFCQLPASNRFDLFGFFRLFHFADLEEYRQHYDRAAKTKMDAVCRSFSRQRGREREREGERERDDVAKMVGAD